MTFDGSCQTRVIFYPISPSFHVIIAAHTPPRLSMPGLLYVRLNMVMASLLPLG